MKPRYALYVAPAPDSPLWRFGSGLIGYDAAPGENLPFPEGLPSDWAALTEEPRRYGFHATLKAPFHLAEGRSEAELVEAAAALAAKQAGFDLPALTIALLGSFVALIPAAPSAALLDLAAACVRDLDPFRAPMSEADRARRLAAKLSERQAVHLERWGYPHVFEDFRFHMTLTGSLPEERREPIRATLAAAYARLAPGLRVDAVSVFRQDDRAGRFRVLARLPFGG